MVSETYHFCYEMGSIKLRDSKYDAPLPLPSRVFCGRSEKQRDTQQTLACVPSVIQIAL